MIPFDLNVKTIYVLLGDSCNFSCKYCIQSDVHEKSILPATINKNIFNFIKKVSLLKTEPLEIFFYGGEPLLYFDKVKEIVKSTRHLNLQYSLITNGSLLNKEMVNFFNANNFIVSISWDGRWSAYTRGEDVFSNDEHKRLIFRINNLCINTVISTKTYILQACEDQQSLVNEYRKNNTFGTIHVNCDEIYDFTFSNRDLSSFDYQRISEEVAVLLKDCANYLASPLDLSANDYQDSDCFSKLCFLERYFRLINEYFKFKFDSYKIVNFCKNGFEILNMDLQGNLYSCHNTRDVIGNIDNLDLVKYIANYMKLDDTKLVYKTTCNKCEFYKVCFGRCKILSLEVRKNTLCRMKEAIGKPIFEFLKQYNK